MVSGAANFTSTVDNVFLFVLAVSVVLLFLITFLMVYFVFKYNRRRNPQPKDIHGNVALELVWTLIPVILVLAMFYYGMIGYRDMKTVPEDAMHVKVTGRMWSWGYTYDNGLQTDTLFVPVGKPVKVDIESADVIHSFFIPAFRIKQDAVPGQTFYLWFTAEKPGNYEVMCAEYCGLQHSYMLSHLVALPEKEFEVWYASKSGGISVSGGETSAAGASKPSAKLAEQGAELVKVKGCVACHSLDGSQIVGPTFKGLFGKTEHVLVDGKEEEITVDEAYIHESILNPNAKITKGFQPLMPPMEGQLTEEEIQAIIEFLKGVK